MSPVILNKSVIKRYENLVSPKYCLYRCVKCAVIFLQCNDDLS